VIILGSKFHTVTAYFFQGANLARNLLKRKLLQEKVILGGKRTKELFEMYVL